MLSEKLTQLITRDENVRTACDRLEYELTRYIHSTARKLAEIGRLSNEVEVIVSVRPRDGECGETYIYGPESSQGGT